MPILKGSVTFARFRVEGHDEREKNWIQKNLAAHAFEPLRKASEDERAAGFVELEDRDAIGFATGNVVYGEFALFSYRVDTLKVPGGQLREELERWLKTFEAEHTRPASRREKTEARTNLKAQLRQKLSPRVKTFDVSWNLTSNELLVWASSRKTVEEIEAAVEKALSVELHPVGPATVAAAHGLADDALAPTAELSWPDFDAEVTRGEA